MKAFLTGLVGAAAAAAAFAGLGALAADKPEGGMRAFELRTYHVNEGKMDALHKRFKDITNKYFAKYNMTPIAYWVDSKEPQKTLIYVLAFPSKEAGEKSWKQFIADPERIAEFKETEKDGKLVKSIDSVWMTPAEYSAIK